MKETDLLAAFSTVNVHIGLLYYNLLTKPRHYNKSQDNPNFSILIEICTLSTSNWKKLNNPDIAEKNLATVWCYEKVGWNG